MPSTGETTSEHCSSVGACQTRGPNGGAVQRKILEELCQMDRPHPDAPDQAKGQAELVAGGAVRCDSMQEIRFVASGQEMTRGAASATNVLASRSYLEGRIRRRVLGIPNVTLVDGTSVHGLLPGPDGVSVVGVQLPDEVLTCDLVVVATGRAGQLPVWLEALGFPCPRRGEARG
jgi:hypothetical protein